MARSSRIAAFLLVSCAIVPAARATELPGSGLEPLLKVHVHRLRAVGPTPPIFLEDSDFLVDHRGTFASLAVFGDVTSGPFLSRISQGAATAASVETLGRAFATAQIGTVSGACHTYFSQPVWVPGNEVVLSWFGGRGRTTTLRFSEDAALEDCAPPLEALLRAVLDFRDAALASAGEPAVSGSRQK